jgi:hypothetical protein
MGCVTWKPVAPDDKRETSLVCSMRAWPKAGRNLRVGASCVGFGGPMKRIKDWLKIEASDLAKFTDRPL